MKLHELQSVEGSRRDSYRKGRGIGSGNGKTAGKGHKGQNARSGGGVRLGFEGGQLPLFRRLPKRGFKNFGRVEYATINLSDLNVFNDGDEVNLTVLVEKGLIKKELDGLKVLGNGKLTKKVTITANKFSKAALEGINKAGAKANILE